MYFSFDISPAVSALLVLTAAAVAVAVVYTAVQSRRIARARHFCDIAESDDSDMVYEPVSVVVYSQDEAEALDKLLRDILTQDYPADMEVIVVNEGESSDVRDVVDMLKNEYPGLYLTNTPDGARNLSRKKLALTLGVKAARHSVVVHTAIGAEILSPRWLRGMARHFSQASPVEVVIGYAAPSADSDFGRGARCRAFDGAVRAARWLGAAVAGHPFRATELNVAYRREAFFRNKGFSRSLNLHFGDDDIFISEIANGENTAVELGGESILGVLAHDYSAEMRRTAMRHIFTEGHIRRRPRLWASLSSVCVPLSLCSAVAAVVLESGNSFVLSASDVMEGVLAAGITLGWRRVQEATGVRVLGASVFPLALGYPFRRALLSVRARYSKQKRYTWD